MELPRIIIVMGVSGVGKTSFGRALAQKLDYCFEDADAYHPAENVAKMAAGVALDDEDRRPWLNRLVHVVDGALRDTSSAPRGLVLACSALRARYRESLGVGSLHEVALVHLVAPRETLAARLEGRLGHFMKASLLDSQLATLEAPLDALTLDATKPLHELVEEAHGALFRQRPL